MAFRYEAENFVYGWGFNKITGQPFASGGGYVSLSPGQVGAGQLVFTGPSGRYEVVIHYFDENDGVSPVIVDVGGDANLFYMDGISQGSTPSSLTAASRKTHDDVQIDAGEVITFYSLASGGEQGAIDYIEFIPVDEEPAPAPAPAPAPIPEPTPAPPPSGDTPEALDPFEQEVLALTNELRADAGLPPLRYNAKLSAAADKHSEDMALNNYFSHTGLDGDRVGDRVRDEGYDWDRVGENIAAGYDTPAQVVQAWFNSSGHRANLLNPHYDEIGVGFYRDDPSDRYDEYWTQVFASGEDVA